MVNLVRRRNKWRADFESGKPPFSPILEKYREERDGENWRTTSLMEVLLEYILFLERKLEESEPPCDKKKDE